MKKSILGLGCLLLLASCNQEKEKAKHLLSEADKAYQMQDFNGARVLLDSLKHTYPKAFEVRKEAQQLMAEIIKGEQARSIDFLDEQLNKRQQQVDSLLKQVVFEKDTAYQYVGYYIAPSQQVEKSAGKSFLKFQVDENGLLQMTSVYTGGKELHHKNIQIIAKDGSNVSANIEELPYTTSNLGRIYEYASFDAPNAIAIAQFIQLHEQEPLEIRLTGSKGNYKYSLSNNEKSVALQMMEISRAITSLQQIRKQKEEAERKLEFVKRKQEQQYSKEK